MPVFYCRPSNIQFKCQYSTAVTEIFNLNAHCMTVLSFSRQKVTNLMGCCSIHQLKVNKLFSKRYQCYNIKNLLRVRFEVLLRNWVCWDVMLYPWMSDSWQSDIPNGHGASIFTAVLIFSFRTRQRCVVSSTLVALHLQKEHLYPVKTRKGGL